MPAASHVKPMSIIVRGPQRSESGPRSGLRSPVPWLSATSEVTLVSGTSRPRARAGANGYPKRRVVLRTKRASATAASSTTSRRGAGMLLEVLRQELHRSRARERRAGRVIGATLVAVEAVSRRRIDVERQLGVRGADLRVVIRRDGLVRLAEVEQHGAARLLGGRLGDATAVVAHGTGDAVDSGRGEPGERAAQAVADDRDLEPLGLERLDGRADVLDHVVDVDLAPDLATAVDVGGLVAGLEAALGAIEDGGRQRDVTVLGEAVGDALDVGVHTKDLLDDDDTALGLTGGRRAIRLERVAVLGLELNHLAHRGILRGPPWGEPEFRGECRTRTP